MALRIRGDGNSFPVRSLINANQDLQKPLDRILPQDTIAIAIRVLGFNETNRILLFQRLKFLVELKPILILVIQRFVNYYQIM